VPARRPRYTPCPPSLPGSPKDSEEDHEIDGGDQQQEGGGDVPYCLTAAKIAKVASQHDGGLRGRSPPLRGCGIDASNVLTMTCVFEPAQSGLKIANEAWRSSNPWRTSVVRKQQPRPAIHLR
jgi:hypothetical protein